MWITVLVAFGILSLLGARSTGKAIVTTPVPYPSLKTWSIAVTPYAAIYNVQVPYALKWVDEESGGNPCAIGYPPSSGPDGNPREMGIAQFYNPDDLKVLGITGNELRSYCESGNQHSIMYKGKMVTGFSSKMIRPMTRTEMDVQAKATIGLISKSMKAATADLVAIGAGPSWSRMTRNYWTLVKLQHGLPGISRTGLSAVTKYLGRPPISWLEFRKAIDHVTLDPNTEKYRSEFKAILDNAENCGNSFVETGVA